MNVIEESTVKIKVGNVNLIGDLCLPKDACGLIIFSHGSGSSRLSPRNQFVADILNEKSYGTLLFDLLTEEEALSVTNRFDIDLLTNRLIAVTNWVLDEHIADGLKLAYFGASTGAASALKAASFLGSKISAVVSRGGRPDLAMDDLSKISVPVQLIVGGNDTEVIKLNQIAYKRIHSPKELVIVNGATHLFEEAGKLEEVAENAARWFECIKK